VKAQVLVEKDESAGSLYCHVASLHLVQVFGRITTPLPEYMAEITGLALPSSSPTVPALCLINVQPVKCRVLVKHAHFQRGQVS
jgi:hypothetical protein